MSKVRFKKPVFYPTQRFLVQAQAGYASHHGEMYLMIEVVADIGNAEESDHMVLAIFDNGQYFIFFAGRQAAI